jgi:hypothetical protein
MNAILSNLQPLPAALQSQPAPDFARRRLVGGYPLDRKALQRFNQLLAKLRRTPLDRDQIASAARQLEGQSAAGPQPDCIEQRLHRATAIGLMVADPGWQPANDAIAQARLVMDYVRSDSDLIPDCLARVGRLDDAIVIDAAWPQLGEEVCNYLDYCRLRHIEAELRGCDESTFAFGRDDWEQARRAETAWIAHCRKVGTRSYLPLAPAPGFRIC